MRRLIGLSLVLVLSLVQLPCFCAFAIPIPTFQRSTTVSTSRRYSNASPEKTTSDATTAPQGTGPPVGTSVGGGAPAGVAGGGGPPVAGGGPPKTGGPPTGAGPPPQTFAQKALEQVLEVAFSIMYAGNDLEIRDSSKNLRVLWTRALLASLNEIDDDVAFDMLPANSRWIVGKSVAPLWSSQVVEKLDWIVNRTQFIDSQLEEFLEETASSPKRQVLVLGSGYDTRAIRYRQSNLQFYAVDLPEVSSNQAKLVGKYLESRNDSSDSPIHIPFDLNEVLTRNKSLIATLEEKGFDSKIPTFVICEAVLFYLIPGAVQKLTSELFGLKDARFCFTDNLAKVGVAPGPPFPVTAKQKCEKWLQDNKKELIAHDAIWGGAVHFVGAK